MEASRAIGVSQDEFTSRAGMGTDIIGSVEGG